MILYVAGPASEDPGPFQAAYATLTAAGYHVLCFHPSPNATALETRCEKLRMMLCARGVCLLAGWDKDEETLLAHHIAVQVGLPSKQIALWLADADLDEG